MTAVTLDKTLCDWVTLTGHEHYEIREQWGEFMATTTGYKKSSPRKWLQWQGDIHSFDEGNIFTGSMVDNYEDWLCVRASGEIANDLLLFFYPLVERGIMRVTRLDVQITTVEPKGWGQINLCNRLYSRGKRASFLGSLDLPTGKALETVGVGSRRSETFTRIYQKLTDGGDRLLRLEVEYKGEKARAIARDIKTATLTQMIKHHVQSKLGDDKLTAVFANPLDGIRPHNAKPTVQARNKRKKWLMTMVLPSFEEFINDHSDDGEVVQAFQSVLNELYG